MRQFLEINVCFRDRVAVAPIPTPTQGLAALRAGATLGSIPRRRWRPSLQCPLHPILPNLSPTLFTVFFKTPASLAIAGNCATAPRTCSKISPASLGRNCAC